MLAKILTVWYKQSIILHKEAEYNMVIVLNQFIKIAADNAGKLQ